MASVHRWERENQALLQLAGGGGGAELMPFRTLSQTIKVHRLTPHGGQPVGVAQSAPSTPPAKPPQCRTGSTPPSRGSGAVPATAGPKQMSMGDASNATNPTAEEASSAPPRQSLQPRQSLFGRAVTAKASVFGKSKPGHPRDHPPSLFSQTSCRATPAPRRSPPFPRLSTDQLSSPGEDS